jgi:hypothetical protein
MPQSNRDRDANPSISLAYRSWVENAHPRFSNTHGQAQGAAELKFSFYTPATKLRRCCIAK